MGWKRWFTRICTSERWAPTKLRVVSSAHRFIETIKRCGSSIFWRLFLGAIKEPEAARLFSEMCTALDYLHGIGIVHRDLKCENVLLSSQNQIKLGLFTITAYALLLNLPLNIFRSVGVFLNNSKRILDSPVQLRQTKYQKRFVDLPPTQHQSFSKEYPIMGQQPIYGVWVLSYTLWYVVQCLLEIIILKLYWRIR